MTLIDALHKTGLTESFKRLCLSGVRSSTILRRLRNDSRMKKLDVFYPTSLHYTKEKLGVAGEHGGKRDMSTARPNIVVANGRITVHAQTK